MITIKSMNAQAANTVGNHPAKVVVMVEIPVKEFNKLCPVTGSKSGGYLKARKATRDLGSLVLEVNNMVYALNPNIPSYYPSIDSQGGTRAKNDIKTLEFVYFIERVETCEALGFKTVRGHVLSYGVNINLLAENKV